MKHIFIDDFSAVLKRGFDVGIQKVGTRKKKKKKRKKKKSALTGNRTRASRVAGENSTTEPSVLDKLWVIFSRL